jgi:hypothetical protein
MAGCVLVVMRTRLHLCSEIVCGNRYWPPNDPPKVAVTISPNPVRSDESVTRLIVAPGRGACASGELAAGA